MVSPSGAGASPSQPVKSARVPRPHRATEPPPAVPPVNANALPPSRQSVRFPEHGREEPAVRIRLHSHARAAPLGGTPHRSPALRHLREPLIDEPGRPLRRRSVSGPHRQGRCPQSGMHTAHDQHRRSRVVERQCRAHGTRLGTDWEDQRVAAVRLGDARAQARSQPGTQRTFYGWAVFVAECVRGNGLRITPSPTQGNPYHADILPNPEAGQHDILIECLQRVADVSEWLSRDVTWEAMGSTVSML